MKRIAGYFLLVTLLSLPAQAIGPLAFMAKDLVKSIVNNFVEGQIDKMLASAGPCGLPIAGPGAGGLAGKHVRAFQDFVEIILLHCGISSAVHPAVILGCNLLFAGRRRQVFAKILVGGAGAVELSIQ